MQGTKDIVGKAHRLVKEILSQCDDAKYEEVFENSNHCTIAIVRQRHCMYIVGQ